MKTFSEITDTDLDLDLVLTINPLCHNGIPTSLISVDKHILFNGPMSTHTVLKKKINLLDDIVIQVDLQDKIYDQHLETALHFTSITVDGIEITDHCYGLIEYDNDQDKNEQTTYLGFNGSWVLRIPGPFYRWWHSITGQGWLLTGSRLVARD